MSSLLFLLTQISHEITIPLLLSISNRFFRFLGKEHEAASQRWDYLHLRTHVQRTELLRLHDRQSIAKKNCVLVKYAGDTRYDDNLVATHSKVTGQGNTVKCNRLEEVRAQLFAPSVDVVSIDEGQFFTDLAATCDELAEAGKRVYVAALSGTFERKAFPQITILLPYCDDIKLLSAVCCCGADACYTFRCTKDKKVEVIGGQDTYMALCRSCFYAKSLERDRDEFKSEPLENRASPIVVRPFDQSVIPRKVQILEKIAS